MPTVRPPTVSMQLLQLMGQHLRSRGVEPGAFRRQVGVSELELARPDGRLDVRRFRRARSLMEQLGRMEDFDQRPAGGWVGWVVHGWPELASLWFNSPSLGAAIQACARYRPLIGEPDALLCAADGDRLVLHHVPDAGAGASLLGALSNLLMVTDIVGHYSGRLASPVSMQCELGDVGRPVSPSRVAELVQAPVRIDATTRSHRVILQGRGLWAPAAEHHPLIHGWSVQALDVRLHVLTRTSASDLLAFRVGEVIERCWAGADGELELPNLSALLQDVARALGMSRWTLRRHLAAGGLDFAEIVEERRALRLPTLMSDPSLNLLEVGSQLGFASQSAFSRYFRSRFGHPPSRDPTRRGRG